MYQPKPNTDGFSPVGQLVATLSDDSRRMTMLVVVAYVTGPLGLGVSFLGDLWNLRPPGLVMSVGIVLMSVSFLSLFLVSVTLPGVDDDPHNR